MGEGGVVAVLVLVPNPEPEREPEQEPEREPEPLPVAVNILATKPDNLSLIPRNPHGGRRD